MYTEEMAKDVFKQVLTGLKYLHSKGVCHRDIKPQNLYITKSDSRVLILDYNVAKQRSEDGELHMRTKTGTAAFSAPEIIGAACLNPYTEKVDVWSAGVVLFMLLSGHLPFLSENLPELV